MRYVVSLALLASAVLTYLAEWQRWYPACAGRFSFDSPECLAVQDHSYDDLFATQLVPLSWACLAVAALFLFRSVVDSPWSWLPGVLAAACFGALAMDGLSAIAAGRTVAGTGTAATVGVVFVWPLALVALALAAASLASREDRRWRAVSLACVLLMLASPIPLYFASSLVLLYASHDTTPWAEAVGGVFCAGAAIALLLVPRPVAPRVLVNRVEQHVEP